MLISTLSTVDVGGQTRVILTELGKFIDTINAATVLDKAKHQRPGKRRDRKQAQFAPFIEKGPWTCAAAEEGPSEERTRQAMI